MCYTSSCDPRCGKCIPKKVVDLLCPECCSLNLISRESFLNTFELPHKRTLAEEGSFQRDGSSEPVCRQCGADLRETLRAAVEPQECQRSRIVCAYPCGRRNEPFVDDGQPCEHMVPLSRLP